MESTSRAGICVACLKLTTYNSLKSEMPIKPQNPLKLSLFPFWQLFWANFLVEWLPRLHAFNIISKYLHNQILLLSAFYSSKWPTCKVLPFYNFWFKFYDKFCSLYPIVGFYAYLITKVGNHNLKVIVRTCIPKTPVWKIMNMYCCMFFIMFSLSACALSSVQSTWENQIWITPASFNTVLAN